MMLDASRHEFDLLLFWKLDRVSREGISVTLRYLENLKAWGVGWRSYQEPWLDTGNEMVTNVVLSVISRNGQARAADADRSHDVRIANSEAQWQNTRPPAPRY